MEVLKNREIRYFSDFSGNTDVLIFVNPEVLCSFACICESSRCPEFPGSHLGASWLGSLLEAACRMNQPCLGRAAP